MTDGAVLGPSCWSLPRLPSALWRVVRTVPRSVVDRWAEGRAGVNRRGNGAKRCDKS